MIRVYVDEPLLLTILPKIEAAIGAPAIAADDHQAIFNPPVRIIRERMAAVTRSARVAIEVNAHEPGEAVDFADGRSFTVDHGSRWTPTAQPESVTIVQVQDLGPCCGCGAPGDHRNIYQLDFEAPPGFTGWGCLVCDAPMRGAIAIMCDDCNANDRSPVAICGGKNAAERVRVPLESYERRPFGHDLTKHPELGGPRVIH